MGLRNFAEKLLWLQPGEPFSLSGRDYLVDVYASQARRVVLRAARQVEKSTFVVNRIIYQAVTKPGSKILYVCPREHQARTFSNERLIPTVRNSPFIARLLLSAPNQKLSVMDIRFANGSTVHIRAAYKSADPARGISANLLAVDEYQDIAPGILPVLEETLSHARDGRTILTGTPKLITNHLESYFRQSTANEFLVPCACGEFVLLDEKCLGLHGIECPKCHQAIDVRNGHWAARNPQSTWGDGYCINQLMLPHVMNYHEVLEKKKSYDNVQFRNEVLGLPSSMGDHIVTLAELEACCTTTPMARSLHDVPPSYQNLLVAGIDWGGGVRTRTSLVIGYVTDNFRFVIVRFAHYDADEEALSVVRSVCQELKKFRVGTIAADGGGNGSVYNGLLYQHLETQCAFYAIFYSIEDGAPEQSGVFWKWTIGRTASIAILFARVKNKTIEFPRIADCAAYLDEFACEIKEFKDGPRSVNYTHPDGLQDDALHAATYAFRIGARFHHRRDFSLV